MQKLLARPQLIFNFIDSSQFKFTVCLFYSILFCAKTRTFDFTVTPASPPQSCPSICICGLNVTQTCTWPCLYFSPSSWGAPRPRSVCILCFIYKATISFYHTRTWETAGEKDGEEGEGKSARRRHKEMWGRYKQKRHKNADKRIDGIREKCGEQKKSSYYKHVEPLVPQLCMWQSRLKPFHFLLLIPLHFSASEHKHR